VFIVCRPWKTNFHFPFPFAANKQKFAVSVFGLQQINRSCCFLLVLFIFVFIFSENRTLYLYATVSSGKRKSEAQGNFPQSVLRLLIMQTEVCRLSIY
jgi:hypothetical protein